MKAHLFFKYLSIFAILLFSSCGSKKGGEVQLPMDQLSLDLPLPIHGLAALKGHPDYENSPHKKILTALQTKSSVPVEVLIEAVIWNHWQEFNGTSKSDKIDFQEGGQYVSAYLESLLGSKNLSDFSDLKEKFDRQTSDYLKNDGALSIFDMILKQRLFYHSATVLSAIALQQLGNNFSNLETGIPVVIYTKGKSYIGFVKSKNGVVSLIGQDYTSLGESILRWSDVNREDFAQEVLRVVPLHDFLVVEALRPFLSLSRPERENLLTFSLGRLSEFGLPVKRLEANVLKVNPMAYKEWRASSAFSFADNPYVFFAPTQDFEDRDRDEFELRDGDEGGISPIIPGDDLDDEDPSSSPIPSLPKRPKKTQRVDLADGEVVILYTLEDVKLVYFSNFNQYFFLGQSAANDLHVSRLIRQLKDSRISGRFVMEDSLTFLVNTKSDQSYMLSVSTPKWEERSAEYVRNQYNENFMGYRELKDIMEEKGIDPFEVFERKNFKRINFELL